MQSTLDSVQDVSVAKIGVISVTSSLYNVFSKFFVEHKRLLRAIGCGARRACANEVNSCDDKR
jgi:hypothetical protein